MSIWLPAPVPDNQSSRRMPDALCGVSVCAPFKMTGEVPDKALIMDRPRGLPHPVTRSYPPTAEKSRPLCPLALLPEVMSLKSAP